MRSTRSRHWLKSIGENFEVFLRNYKLINIDLEEFTNEERAGALARANARAEFDVLTVKRVFAGFEFFSLLEDFPHWISRFQILN